MEVGDGATEVAVGGFDEGAEGLQGSQFGVAEEEETTHLVGAVDGFFEADLLEAELGAAHVEGLEAEFGAAGGDGLDNSASRLAAVVRWCEERRTE